VHKFEEIYKKLNDEQKQAVDTIDGPLLVLAGPGTGKTQLLSARVANILTKTDTSPANIVCLTFTVNAANNMRERLRKMIGLSANQVVIKTFHSLAAEIITSNPEHFYAGAVRNPVSELAAQEMLLSILDKLPHDNPLAARFDDKYVHLGNALEAIGRAKDAGLSPAKLKAAINGHKKDLEAIEHEVVSLLSKTLSNKTLQLLADECQNLASKGNSALAKAIARLVCEAVENDLPTGKTTETGKLKAKLLSTDNGQKVMARERKANVWWAALTDVYEQYQAMLYKRGYLDYSDMLISVIDVLEADEDLRLDIQESIHYLLIDEFQDSNEAQIKLMHLLIDNLSIDSPNVMVVGDPNQTIYGFNGAMLDNTTDFQQFYAKHLNTIDLTSNYRSSQAILDDARTVIAPYSDFHPDLIAKNEPESSHVAYTSYATEAEQAVAICRQIQSVFGNDKKATVAVLARSHKSLGYLARYLIQSKLTVNYEQNIDIRTTACNQLIITTLSLIQAVVSGDRQACDYQLSLLLRHEAFELNPATTWQLALQSNRKSNWLEQASNHPETKPITHWVQQLVSVAASEPLHVLIEQLLSLEFWPGKTLYQKLYQAKTSEENIIEAQSTRQLIELAKQYAQTDHVNLTAFLGMINGTSDKLFRFSPTTGHYEHAVTLMTVHGAKGLEFDYVFVIDADEGNWKPKAARYPTPLSLPIHVNLDTPSDYARLLYVALTRAKQGLMVSYVSRIDSKTTALPAEQLAHFEFAEAEAIDNEQLAQSEISQLITPYIRPKSMAELLADKLANYSLSATHLTNFLDLTRQGMDTFIEENLVKFPEPASEVLDHGTAMHAAMELAQIQTTNSSFNLSAIKRLYERELKNSNLTTIAIERLITRAHKQLDTLFTDFGLLLDPTSQPEQGFAATTKAGISMYGKIDRIDTLDDATIRIIDYKSGKVISNPASKSQETLLKQWRHRLQLGFYILLIAQQRSFANKHIKAQIMQLDATAADHLYLSYEFDKSELARIERLSAAVFKRIKTLDFPDVSRFEPTLKGIADFEDSLLE
jgi:DNA helicase-2/ATP-dependent DNA helicase PcrA